MAFPGGFLHSTVHGLCAGATAGERHGLPFETCQRSRNVHAHGSLDQWQGWFKLLSMPH